MKCPKCGYVSFEYLDMCKKCQHDLTMFKEERGIFAIKPGFIDLAILLDRQEGEEFLEESAQATDVLTGAQEEEESVPTHSLLDEDLEGVEFLEEDRSEDEEERPVPTIALDEEADLSLDLSALDLEEEEETPPRPETSPADAEHLIGLGDLAQLEQKRETSAQEAAPEASATPAAKEEEHLIDLQGLEELGIETPEHEVSPAPAAEDIPAIDFTLEEEESEEKRSRTEPDISMTELSDLEEETEQDSIDLGDIDFELDLEDWDDQDEDEKKS